VGYRLENPATGTAARFLGMTVPIGPLDNAALLSTVDGGLPGQIVALPIEVKNLRDWLYPTNAEVYQLLLKAARLQQAHSSVRIMPLLITRRMHITTFRMLKNLGAYAVQTKRQYISAVEGGAQRIEEVRTGLGFLDLTPLDADDDLITRRFTRGVPRDAARVSEDWAITASDAHLVNLFAEIRAESRIEQRAALLYQIRLRMDDVGRYGGGW
jgi:hypothetical protein